MAVLTICDRCKQICGNDIYHVSSRNAQRPVSRKMNDPDVFRNFEMDICQKCVDELSNFMKKR